MRTYYLVNVLTLMFFITAPVQSQPSKSTDTAKKEETLSAVKMTPEERAKDSLLRLTNKELDEAIRKSNTITNKQEQLAELKESRRKAEKEFLTAVTNYVNHKGKKEVVIVKKNTDVFTQLKEGEIYFIKDSSCVKYKRPLFGKKRCVQWGNYKFSLEDKFGNIEKL